MQKITRAIVGSFESVKLPALGNMECIAKVDTGAYYGAVHVDAIEINGKGDAIATLGGKDYVFPAESVQQSRVKSASGHQSRRVVVTMPIKIQGKTYRTWIGLTRRSGMKFPMLLGRYFLRENNILVDVKINNHHDTDGRRLK
ncbi:MAG TPA: hypothetical protein GXZ59_06615 [Clostridiaceae bacterium]|nr:hypothetical protein [Clostridiaceae bacterium]